MKVSELITVLQRVSQLAGDIEVELQAVGTEAKSYVTGLGLTLDAVSASPTSSLVIVHDTTAPTPPEPEQPAPGTSLDGGN